MLTVVDDLVVSLDYRLHLGDDELVDSSEGRGPLEVVQGRGQIIPGLETALYGMALGEEKHVEVAPADGYGEYDDDLFDSLPRDAFPKGVELEPGMGFRMRNDSGAVVVVYVDSAEDDQVRINLNHPLAGETLHFDVKIAGLRPATPQELAGGCGGSCSSCCGGCDDQEGCGRDDDEAGGCGGGGNCCS